MNTNTVRVSIYPQALRERLNKKPPHRSAGEKLSSSETKTKTVERGFRGYGVASKVFEVTEMGVPVTEKRTRKDVEVASFG